MSSLLWLETQNDPQTWEKALITAQGCTQKFMYNSTAQLNPQLLWMPWKSGISSYQTCKLGDLHSLLQTAVLQIRLYKARSKSGKQVKQGAAWMTACETLLLETGSMPASSFLWCFPFRFESTVNLWLFWRFFFSFEHCVLASRGSRAMGAPGKKKKRKGICSSRIQSSGLLPHLLLALHTYSTLTTLLAAVDFPVPSLSVRGIVRASSISVRKGNYFETYVATGT